MAFAGGYLVKPVKSNLGELGDFYLQGQAQIQKVRDEVRKERKAQQDALGEATKFEVTGIADMDKYWADYGNKAANQLMANQEANRNGDMSRAEVQAYASSLTTEMSMIGQLPTMIKEKSEEIQKAVENEKLSNLTLDQYQSTWFKDENLGVTTYTYDDATGVKKNLQKNYTTEIIDGKTYMNYTFQYVAGKEEYEENGVKKTRDIIETSSVLKPLRSHVDPNYRKISLVDDKESVKEWANNLGKQNFVYTAQDGSTQVARYNPMMTTGTGTNILSRISDPADVGRVATVLETEVNGKSEEFYLSYAYDVLGARAPFHSGGGAPLTKTEWEQKFPSNVYFNYDNASNSGTPLTFKSDPLSLTWDSEGNATMSDDTLNLAKAHYRNQLMASIDVDSDVYKDRNYKRTGPKPSSVNSPAAASYTVAGKGLRVTGNNFMSRVAFSQANKNYISGDGSNLKSIEAMSAQLTASGEATYDASLLPQTLSQLNNSTKYDQVTQGALNIGGMKKNLAETLNVNTFTNNKFETITGYYSAEDVNTGQQVIVMIGNANYGDQDITTKSDGSSLSETKTSGSNSYVKEGFSGPLSDTDAQNLYRAFFDEENGSPQMVEIMKSMGYDENTPNYKLALHEAQDKINKGVFKPSTP